MNIEFKYYEYPKDWILIADIWLNLFNKCPYPCVFYHPIFIAAADVLPVHLYPTHIVLGYQADIPVFGLPIILKKYCGFLNQLIIFNGLGFDYIAPLDITKDFRATKDFFTFINNYYCQTIIQGNGLENGFKKILEQICAENRFKIFVRPFFRCPYLSLPANPEELIQGFSKKFRFNLRYSLKQAEKIGIDFRTLTSASQGHNFTEAFENLLNLHNARCESISRNSNFLETASKEYYRDICKRAAKSDKIGWFTEAIYRGQVIGSLFGFLTKTRFYFYQHGFLAQYSYLSIGNLLVYKTMLELINKKICTFYFLRGADSYKFNWTKTVDHEFFVMIGSSLIGKFALEWFRLQRSIRRNGRLRGIRYILSNKD